MSTIIFRNSVPKPQALFLPNGRTKDDPSTIIPISGDDFRGAQHLAEEILAKYGYDPAAIDRALTLAEQRVAEKHRVQGARIELRRKVEGNGMWEKRGERWVLKERYRRDI